MLALLASLAAALRTRSPGRSWRRMRRSRWLLVLGTLAILSWQTSFMLPGTHLDATYRITASTGIYGEPNFLFYLRRMNLFPVMAKPPPRVDTTEEARRILRERPKDLYMDQGLTFRSGDRGRVFLYYVDAIFNGKTINPSIRPASVAAFVAALVFLFWAAWRIRRPWLGLLLVLLLGSDPFQLNAVFAEENVFCWPITAMILVLALNLPLLLPAARGEHRARRTRRALVIALMTGLLLATLRTVRSEPAVLLASVTLVYATLSHVRILHRGGVVLAAILTFSIAGGGYAWYFRHKTEQAATVIARHGGIPYTGPMQAYHEFWHPVFCGLGDFDKKYGYAWDDRVAYAYAAPILEKRAGKPLHLNPTFWAQRDSYDGTGRYPVTFFETPGYHDVIRDKILGDIKRDPGWYFDILKKRAKRILTDTTPVSIAFGGKQLLKFSSSWLGPLAIPLLLWWLVRRDGFRVKLLLFSVPLSLNAFLVYSDRGLTGYSCFHLFAVALVVTAIGSTVSDLVARPLWLRLRRQSDRLRSDQS